MSSILPPHPHGVEPEGNLWALGQGGAAAALAKRATGLGSLALLDDVMLLRVLQFNEPPALAALCCTSGVLGAFACHEDLWRVACIWRANSDGALTFFAGSWKATLRRLVTGKYAAAPAPSARRTRGTEVFSDALYRTHELTYAASAFGEAPEGPPCARLAREAAPDVESFAAGFEAGEGKPLVLEGANSSAIATGAWEEAALCNQLGDRVLHAGGVNFSLRAYVEYAHSNVDDQPQYLFDPTFASVAPELIKEYAPAPYFQDDLFSLLDTPGVAEGGSGGRPAYRWLLVGGARSGQVSHASRAFTGAFPDNR